MTRAIHWLHLTDLHCGATGMARDWATVRDAFDEDVAYMTRKLGAPDLILFTGDLTYGAKREQYDEVAAILAHIDEKIGSQLPVFAVPGNHDVERNENLTSRLSFL